MISGKYKPILSDTIISIAIVQLTAACMVSAAMAEVEAEKRQACCPGQQGVPCSSAAHTC